MDAIQATAAAATTATDTSSTGTTTSSTAAATTDAKKSFSALFAEAKADLKSGEKLTKVADHEFARIKGGTRDDQCVNLSGNARNGQAFDLIWRDGHQFHVYGGKGKDHTVVEVGKKAATTTTDAKTTDATTTDTTSGGTASTGTTTTSSDSSTSAKS
jgi:hypothetical protein